MNSFLKWAETYRENGSFLVYIGLTPVVTVYNAIDMEVKYVSYIT